MFTLSDLMFVNSDTLDALQIIQSESHPNSHMQGPNKASSGEKESLSVYGLFHPLACTSQGKQKLRKRFLRPTVDLTVIQRWLNDLRILLLTQNLDLSGNIANILRRIKDIRPIIRHLQKGSGGICGGGSTVHIRIWKSLQQFCFHILKIVEMVTALADNQSLTVANRVRDPILCSTKKQ